MFGGVIDHLKGENDLPPALVALIVAIVRMGSFTRVAAQLGFSQPACHRPP